MKLGGFAVICVCVFLLSILPIKPDITFVSTLVSNFSDNKIDHLNYVSYELTSIYSEQFV
jgi:hypothetical protein